MQLIRDTPQPSDQHTLGIFAEDDGTYICETLELPWRDNAHMISCIPLGVFTVSYAWSPAHQRKLWHIAVPNRDTIEIHIGNTELDTDGCVLVGTSRGVVQRKDGVFRDGILGSHGAFDAFYARDPNFATFTLTVRAA